MASIGSASLLLSTNGTQLKAGLDQAAGQVSGFATKATAQMATLGEAITAALGPIALVAAGIGAAIGLVTNGFSRLNEIAKQTKEATALGIDPTQYAGLSKVLERAGIDASQTGDFFGSLNSKLERAARTGRGPVAAALQEMGVDLGQLMAMPADERFLALADAFQRVGPSASASAAAMNIFGTTALLPTLQRGREAIQGMVSDMRASGEILSGDQARLAQDASKAWTEASRSIKRAWDAVSTQVAVALAPIVKIAADIFKQIVDVAGPIIRGIGQVFSIVIETVTPLFTLLVETVKGMFAFLGDILAEFGFKWGDLRTNTLAVLESIAVVGSWVFDTLKAGVGAVIFVNGIWVEGLGRVVDMYNRINGQITNFAQFGVRMRQWGQDAVTSFGQSQAAVLRFFETLRNKRNQAAQEAARPLAPPAARLGPDMTPAGYSPVKPLLEGSADLYSYQMQWKYSPDTIGDDPKELQREANRQLRDINRNTARNGNADALELAD